ncbi:helix-turn-helix domain-containing protein [Mycolicibacterium vinylchloridicum]|uniref:helix-turn-helix domain-containing protein n=1 Tax=Mycolicibacterium vinylchloridicum TaxID=2736928 RepID=UPI0015CBAE76|nr:helix-turn-helix domain-containing protein [Mycolicibacterium vinylchloridicum]
MLTPLTYSTAEATEKLGAPSEPWLIKQLRLGRLPGRKIGRHWRLTDGDLEECLNIWANTVAREEPKPQAIIPLGPGDSGLTRTSARRVVNL